MKSITLSLCVSIISLSIWAKECEFQTANYTPEQIQLYQVFKNIYDNGGRYTLSDCGEVIVHSIDSNNSILCKTFINVEYIIDGIKIPTHQYYITNLNDSVSVSIGPGYDPHPLAINEESMKYDLMVAPSFGVINYSKHYQHIKFDEQGLINSIKYKARYYLIPLQFPVERVNLSCKL
ncbi:MAG: hypothetical protein A2381_13405 [Bdellovibrionales bacterium RIFOXYB1_FULL_37_110]|nr:MAG: hypothetical protein A2381_13405 [Bdellovibrionales bacterium RIFOXYB1_FULL_37_110]OFZ65100.1 MAG: hypothetical protein A2577_09670 [Bdellovibrionales bacterium RIFOXYD1_FULL_36_51]